MNPFRYYLLMSSMLVTSLAQAVTWERLGMNFEAEPEVYSAHKTNIIRASGEIAGTLSDLTLENIPNEISEKFADKKLTIIFEKNSATDAMFFPPGTYRNSANEEWIISLNPVITTDANYLRIVAHEYFHAIHHSHKPKEESWVREGMAQVFESKNFGGSNQTHVIASLTKNNFSLDENFNTNKYQPEKYGNTFLYFSYLLNQCGNDDSLWDLMKVNSNGKQGIDEYLSGRSQKKQCQSYSSSAEYFSLARMVNSYTGFKQESLTYLSPASYRLEVNPDAERSILRDPKSFFKTLKPFVPFKFTRQTAEQLSKDSTENNQWWAIEKLYPNRVKRVSPADMANLSKSWDVGLILVR